METFREDQFNALGLPYHFVQDNYSRSVKHYAGTALPVGSVDWEVNTRLSGRSIPGRRRYPRRLTKPRRMDWGLDLRRREAPSVGPGWFCPRLLRPFESRRDPIQVHQYTTVMLNRGFAGTIRKSVWSGPCANPRFPKGTGKPKLCNNGLRGPNPTIFASIIDSQTK